MAFTLDDRIEIFTDARFSSENAARHFFASYGEAEVARKLQEMSGLQGEIEKLLKQKVRQNYGMFMNANEEVNKISSEMSDLKKLIDGTAGLIQDVRANRQSESGKIKLNSLVPHLSNIRALASKALHGEFDMLPEEMMAQISNKRSVLARTKTLGSSSSSVANITPWVINAPDDVAKYIVEQQYHHAVSVVLKLRGYVETLQQGIGSQHTDTAPGTPVGDIVRRVEDRASQLAIILHKSLPTLPQSPLWGEEEQKKRMRWLIQLGHPALAADGFSRCQVDLMKRVVRAVEASGDPKRYSTDISRAFYNMLAKSSLEFTAIFSAYKDSPKIMCYLLSWSHQQMRTFISTLTGQIVLGAKEYTALCLMQLKPGFDFDSSVEASIIHQHRDLITAVKAVFPDFPDMFAASCLEYFDWDLTRTTDALLNENLPPQLAILDPRMCAGAKGKVISKGPLTSTMECLDVAFAEATKLDTVGLQGASALGWLLLPELTHVITGICDDVLRETAEQVRHDSWQGNYPRRIVIKDPSHPSIQLQLLRGVGVQAVGSTVLTGHSFDWFTTAISHLLDEIWAFLKAQDDWDTYFHDAHGRRSSFSSSHRGSGVSAGVGMGLDEQATYSREDVCQLEPHIVSCLLRCLLRYVLEIEAIEHSALNNINLQVLHDTIVLLYSYTLPTVLKIIVTHFFRDSSGSSRASDEALSPQSVVEALCERLQEIALAMETTGRVKAEPRGNIDVLEPACQHLVAEEDKKRREERVAAAKIAAAERVMLEQEREVLRKEEEERQRKQKEEDDREREWVEEQERRQREKQRAEEVQRRRALGLPDIEEEEEAERLRQEEDEKEQRRKDEEQGEDEWEDAELMEAIKAARAARKAIEDERAKEEEAKKKADDEEAARKAEQASKEAKEKETRRVEWLEANPDAAPGTNPFGEDPNPKPLTPPRAKYQERDVQPDSAADSGDANAHTSVADVGPLEEGEGVVSTQSADGVPSSNETASHLLEPEAPKNPPASARFLAPVQAYRAKSPTGRSPGRGGGGSTSPTPAEEGARGWARRGSGGGDKGAGSSTSPGPGNAFLKSVQAYRARSPPGRQGSPTSRSDPQAARATLTTIPPPVVFTGSAITLAMPRRISASIPRTGPQGNPPPLPFNDEELAAVRARSASMQSNASDNSLGVPSNFVPGGVPSNFVSGGKAAFTDSFSFSPPLISPITPITPASTFSETPSPGDLDASAPVPPSSKFLETVRQFRARSPTISEAVPSEPARNAKPATPPAATAVFGAAAKPPTPPPPTPPAFTPISQAQPPAPVLGGPTLPTPATPPPKSVPVNPFSSARKSPFPSIGGPGGISSGGSPAPSFASLVASPARTSVAATVSSAAAATVGGGAAAAAAAVSVGGLGGGVASSAPTLGGAASSASAADAFKAIMATTAATASQAAPFMAGGVDGDPSAAFSGQLSGPGAKFLASVGKYKQRGVPSTTNVPPPFPPVVAGESGSANASVPPKPTPTVLKNPFEDD